MLRPMTATDIRVLDAEGNLAVLKGDFSHTACGEWVTTSTLPGCRVWPVVHWGCYLIGAIHCRPGYSTRAMIGEYLEPR